MIFKRLENRKIEEKRIINDSHNVQWIKKEEKNQKERKGQDKETTK